MLMFFLLGFVCGAPVVPLARRLVREWRFWRYGSTVKSADFDPIAETGIRIDYRRGEIVSYPPKLSWRAGAATSHSEAVSGQTLG